MIIQGTNKPITLTFEGTAPTVISASLYHVAGINTNVLIKNWTASDMTISGSTVKLPQTESATMAYPDGKCELLVKWLNSDGKTEFSKKIEDTIVKWDDETVLGG